mmetsp:Transcript_50333/g.110077  ORF Transcript_50333/g.110077 Transcript_50333/m.110077 type:complete len:633 (-) Transcript_50333:9-1907(-)
MRTSSVVSWLSFLWIVASEEEAGFLFNYAQHGNDWTQGRCSFGIKGWGGMQSPIDLPPIPWDARPIGNFTYEYQPISTPLDVFNNGHGLAANLEGIQVGGVMLDGEWYPLLKVTFHAASEHTFAWHRYEAEIHLIHKHYKSSKLLIVAVPVTVGPPIPPTTPHPWGLEGPNAWWQPNIENKGMDVTTPPPETTTTPGPTTTTPMATTTTPMATTSTAMATTTTMMTTSTGATTTTGGTTTGATTTGGTTTGGSTTGGSTTGGSTSMGMAPGPAPAALIQRKPTVVSTEHSRRTRAVLKSLTDSLQSARASFLSRKSEVQLHSIDEQVPTTTAGATTTAGTTTGATTTAATTTAATTTMATTTTAMSTTTMMTTTAATTSTVFETTTVEATTTVIEQTTTMAMEELGPAADALQFFIDPIDYYQPKLLPNNIREATMPMEVHPIDFNQWFSGPDKQSFYMYEGSTTVPPCAEGVTWMVKAQPIEGTRRQLKQLREHITGTCPEGNFRATQPRNGRQVSLVEGWYGGTSTEQRAAQPTKSPILRDGLANAMSDKALYAAKGAADYMNKLDQGMRKASAMRSYFYHNLGNLAKGMEAETPAPYAPPPTQIPPEHFIPLASREIATAAHQALDVMR